MTNLRNLYFWRPSILIFELRLHGLQLVLELLDVDVSFGHLVVVRLRPPRPLDLDVLEQLLLLLLEQVLDLVYLVGLQAADLLLQLEDLALLFFELVLEHGDDELCILIHLLLPLILQQ